MFAATPTTGMIAAAVGVAGIGCVIRWRRVVSGTTLPASCYWTMASLAILALCEVGVGFAGHSESPWHPLFYAAAVGTFCPAISVLGARRPHNDAWQMIVLSLWVVLALPAAEVLFLQRGQQLEIHAARSWFLLILILVGLANGLPTRGWLPALTWSCGQAILLGEYLPFVPWSPDVTGRLGGLAMLSLSSAIRCRGLPERRGESPWNRLWFDYRDMFGALWGLRVLERINAGLHSVQGVAWLGWGGFFTIDGQALEQTLSADEQLALRQSAVNLLRRFVSPAWVDERLGVDDAHTSALADTVSDNAQR